MDELASLRSELYSGRRALSALQQELSQANAEKEEATSRLQTSQQSDVAGQLESLRSALISEQQARRDAEATSASLSHDKQRLQRARDELASSLLESQQRAGEAEDELARAEERLAAANHKLADLTHARPESPDEPAAGTQRDVGGVRDRGHSEPSSADSQLETLQSQVAQLRLSRDKLLAELERQFLEVDQLASENAALSQGLEEAKDAALAWEQQAQGALQQLDSLKDILEESAAWSGGQVEERPREEPGGSQLAGEESAASEADGERSLEKRYLQECAHVAALESQVRALCAELAKAGAVRSLVKRVTLPALLGVENRLQQLAQGARRPVAA
ncbi:hypothetical protein CVIRNUC_010260 [Coccomyxa viridis]|uniref:Uncharacterized protein n=1 Tax=Coccomyxa viridis TaxID=1274662 RepID=A0AAV1IIU8_9CHLO|nr:hypothetical protein CVIRNUC_010260 [Coccomyxa viridis]